MTDRIAASHARPARLSAPGLALTLLATAPLAQSTPQWLSHEPSPRADAAMAFDAARGRTVLFAGLERTGDALADTWEWDGHGWQPMRTGSSPSARRGAAMAYDSTRDCMVLFGGLGTGRLDDTWELKDGNWYQRTPAHRPAPRYDARLAYDPIRQVTVLFGGNDGASLADETWEWDGQDWTRRTPATSPSTTASACAMTWDAGRRRIALYDARLRQLWEWDGTTWTSRSLGAGPFSAREFTMVHDARRSRLVVFGGYGYHLPSDELWEWDGANWSQAQPGDRPGGRSRHTAAYDALRGEMVIFGGGLSTPDLAETWTWDGTRWSTPRPPQRSDSTLAENLPRFRLVLFGGISDAVAGLDRPLLDDTWLWDGYRWTRPMNSQGPSARRSAALAQLRANGPLVLFGGQDDQTPLLDDTWTWSGSIWQQRTPATRPAGRAAHAMAGDLARGVVVMFGGVVRGRGNVDETWEYDGTNWVQRNPALAPPPRSGHGMTYDPVRRRTILYGGDGLNDTWEWDGTSWTQRATSNRPPAGRGRKSLAFDPNRGIVVLAEAGSALTWGFDGTDWTPLQPRVDAEAAELAFDRASDRLVALSSRTAVLGAPSAVQTYSNGCPGSRGVPLLSAGDPWLGNSRFRLDVLGARGSSLGVLALGAGAANLPIGGTCVLLVRQPLTIPFSTSPLGFGTVPLAVPEAPLLRGIDLFTQAVVADPRNPSLGLAVSQGLKLTLGD